MLNKKLYFLICLFITIPLISIYAQGVSINENAESPHPSSILDISSTDKGFLFPRMNTFQRNAIDSPAESLIIFNTDTKCLEVFLEDVWHSLWCPEGDPPEPFNCGDNFTYQEYDYATVQIGTQCWFAENLNVGTRVEGSENHGNSCADIQKYCYNNEEGNCDIYGGLYQWTQVMCGETTEGSRGICPQGWRIPTDTDWKILEGTVDATYGVGNAEWDNTNWRGDNAGEELKDISMNGTNNSGFSGLGGGYRWTDGDYYMGPSIGTTSARFWSSTETGDEVWNRNLSSGSTTTTIGRFPNNKENGLSVRCIRND